MAEPGDSSPSAEAKLPSAQSSPVVSNQNEGKVLVVLLPADSLPKLKQHKFYLGGQQDIRYIAKFLKEKLKTVIGDSTLVYFLFRISIVLFNFFFEYKF